MDTKTEIKDHIKFLHKENHNLYFLSIIVGIATGVIVSIYKYGLNIAANLREHFITREILTNPYKLIFIWSIFIFIGIFVDFLTKKFPTTAGSGIPQVKALILRKLDYIFWLKELGVKFLGGLLGIGAGLSLGREGPSVQLGSYIGYGFSKIFKGNYIDRKYLVTSGSSAGLAGAFGAPLAGVIFSMEEIHRFFSSKLLVCTFLSSIFSNFVARRIFGINPAFDLSIKYPTNINPYLQFLLFIIFGILIAFLGKFFTMTLIKSQDIFKNLKLPRYIKISFIMTLSFIICFIIPEITGGGHELVEALPIVNQTIMFLIILFILKLLFTAISYSTGFQGGIFLPMLVLGAILGKIYALILISRFNFTSDYIVHYMILGMAAFFVAVVRAPVTGTVLILEMTGNFDHLLAIATVSIIAYYVTDILKLEPIYEILYDRMLKRKTDDNFEIYKHEHLQKTLICIPVIAESIFDNKLIKDIDWPKNTLVVSIKRGDTEYIPKGDSIIYSGDILVILLPQKSADFLNEKLFKMGTLH